MSAAAAKLSTLPAELSPIDVTFEQAMQLLAQPKNRAAAAAAPKEPLKVFDPSPVTEQPVKLLEGRYGPYVTDGVTNASVPRGTALESIDFQQALHLLAERAARDGGAPKKSRVARRKRPRENGQPRKRNKIVTGTNHVRPAIARQYVTFWLPFVLNGNCRRCGVCAALRDTDLPLIDVQAVG